MKHELIQEAKNQGWIQIENGGWIVDRNFVTDDFVEMQLKRVNRLQEKVTELSLTNNDLINRVVTIIQTHTARLKDNTEWRDGIFGKLQDIYRLQEVAATQSDRKIVVWKDGTYKVESGNTTEFENDAD